MAENMSYIEFIPHTDKAITQEQCVTMLIRSAVEKLAGIEAPKRAEYIRMIVSELSRIAAPGLQLEHLRWTSALLQWLCGLSVNVKRLIVFSIELPGGFTTSYTRIGVLLPILMINNCRNCGFLTELEPAMVEMDKLMLSIEFS